MNKDLLRKKVLAAAPIIFDIAVIVSSLYSCWKASRRISDNVVSLKEK